MYNTARANIINPIAENTHMQLRFSYFLLITSLRYPLNSSLSTKVIEYKPKPYLFLPTYSNQEHHLVSDDDTQAQIKL
jgi:hypothetical protein